MTLDNEEVRREPRQAAVPARRALLARAAAGLVIGAGAAAAGAIAAPAPAEAASTDLTVTGNLIMTGWEVIAPSGDTTGATDGPAIVAALTASPSLAVQLTSGTYYVNSPIKYPEYSVLRGAGRGVVDTLKQTVIQATAAMDAVICPQGWDENSSNHTWYQGGCRMSGFMVNGNGLSTHGIVCQNEDSEFDNIGVTSVSGDAIRCDAFNNGGTKVLSGNAVNCRVTRCSLQNCGRAIATNEAASGGSVFTDGFACDNIIDGTSGAAGIAINRSAGWKISGNHLYGCQQHAIQPGQMYMTRIVDNYIETWGRSATAATYRAIDGYTGATSDEGSGSVIAGNTLNMYMAPGNSGSSIEGITLAVDGGSTGTWAVTGNLLRYAPAAPTGGPHADGIVWYCNGTGKIIATSTGNNLTGNWTATVARVPNSGTITLSAGA